MTRLLNVRYNFDVPQPDLIILAEMSLRKKATKIRIIFPPHLNNAAAQPTQCYTVLHIM